MRLRKRNSAKGLELVGSNLVESHYLDHRNQDRGKRYQTRHQNHNDRRSPCLLHHLLYHKHPCEGPQYPVESVPESVEPRHSVLDSELHRRSKQDVKHNHNHRLRGHLRVHPVLEEENDDDEATSYSEG